MNVLHVIPTYVPAWRYGGPIRSVHGLATAQTAAGDRVVVFTTDVDGPNRLAVPPGDPVERDGVTVRYFPTAAPRRIGRSPAMGRALRADVRSFDVVHVHSVFLWPTWAAARAAEAAGVPYVVSPRGMLVDDLIRGRGRWRKRAWIAAVERRTLRHAAAIVATSDAEARELSRLHLALAPVTMIPNGIDSAAVESDEPAVAGEAPRLPDAPFVLYLGRLSWKKGIDLLLETLPLVPELALVVAGNDDERLRPALEERAAAAGVSARVVFTGEVRGRTKQDLLAGAAVLALPSTSENFGNAVLEGMAAGLPVVVSPGVGLADAVQEAGAGIVCERTPEALAQAFRRLVEDPATARAMGARGRALAGSRFSWPVIARATREMYERAIAGDAAQAGRVHEVVR